MWYIMNTRTRVATDAPETNQFGHGEGTTFVYAVDSETGKSPKVWATSGLNGPRDNVHGVVAMVQDTGMGHRTMRDHRIVAIRNADGTVEGTVPAGRTIPFWVAK